MTDRILPPSEWHRLDGTALGAVREALNPATTQIAVVEDDDRRIVGCWAAVMVMHAEGAWIAPEHRLSIRVTRRLYRRMKAIVNAAGACAVLTGADSPAVSALLTRKTATPLPQEYLLCL